MLISLRQTMPVYEIKNIGKLSDKLKRKSPLVDKAAALSINKTSTFAIKESIDLITKEVNLPSVYLRQKIKPIGRASVSNLRAIIGTSSRQTLLTRFPHIKTTDGFKVAINTTGGYRDIKNARLMRLKGSGVNAISITNKAAYDAALEGLGSGEGATSAKVKRASRLQRRANLKPFGRTPLSSRSPTQLFTSVREEVKPVVNAFMRDSFLKDYRRLSK
jgi:uncharacterized protein YcbK (DUF882 family)